MAFLTRSSSGGLGAVAAAIALGLALSPGAAEAGCQAKACCHKPLQWINICIKMKRAPPGHLSTHCAAWKMECVPPFGDK
jgi:hypothetical protein